jgi:hypothetical protein
MPDSFERWQEWAIEVTEIINGQSRWFRAFLP